MRRVYSLDVSTRLGVYASQESRAQYDTGRDIETPVNCHVWTASENVEIRNTQMVPQRMQRLSSPNGA